MKLRNLIFYGICIAYVCNVGCGGSSTPTNMVISNSAGYQSESIMMDSVARSGESGSYSKMSTSTEEPVNDQKLIRRVYLELELESNLLLENNTARIQQLAASRGGYTVDMDIDNRSSWASGRLTLKVPKENVDAFLEDVKGLDIKLVSMSDSLEDITMRYVDVATRLEVKKDALRKYRQYLEQAVSVEELLSIEIKIDGIVADIESYEAQLRVMDNQVDYTEVNVNIDCKTSINRDSFWVRAGSRIGSICYNMGDMFLDGLEWLSTAAIVLLFGLPVMVVVIRVFMFAIGKGRKGTSIISKIRKKLQRPEHKNVEE